MAVARPPTCRIPRGINSADAIVRRVRHGPLERDAAIAEADEGASSDHKVVEHGDIEQPPCGDGMRCQMEVLRARCRVAGWMVVDEQDRPRLAPHGLCEELADPDDRSGDVALIDTLLVESEKRRPTAPHAARTASGMPAGAESWRTAAGTSCSPTLVHTAL